MAETLPFSSTDDTDACAPIQTQTYSLGSSGNASPPHLVPGEIWDLILRSATYKELKAMSLTCKWMLPVAQAILCKCLNLESLSPQTPQYRLVVEFIERGHIAGNVQEINFAGPIAVRNRLMNTVPSGDHREISEYPLITEFVKASSQLKNLRALSFTRIAVDGTDILLLSDLPNLARLSLEDCLVSDIDNPTQMEVGECPPLRLKELVMIQCNLDNASQAVLDFLLSPLTLQFITIISSPLMNNAMNLLRFPFLLRFRTDGHPIQPPHIQGWLSRLPSLMDADFSPAERPHDRMGYYSQDLQGFHPLTATRGGQIRRFRGTIAYLGHFLCRSIRSITLIDSSDVPITNAVLLNAVDKCPNLEALEIKTSSISLDFLTALGEFPELKVLSVYHQQFTFDDINQVCHPHPFLFSSSFLYVTSQVFHLLVRCKRLPISLTTFRLYLGKKDERDHGGDEHALGSREMIQMWLYKGCPSLKEVGVMEYREAPS